MWFGPVGLMMSVTTMAAVCSCALVGCCLSLVLILINASLPTACALAVTGHTALQATPLSDLPASSEPDSPQKTPKRNRCFVCRKKVGLTGTDEH